MNPNDNPTPNKGLLEEVVAKLNDANNVLVTVSNNPSVDQLSACIGLTLALNKKKKHATAVFSGQVPSTIDFLEPDKTLEKNTDSLRDFIISLDKAKADKLRYKVEDNVVRIFITPYKTSISDADLEFSQGDFNVDAVVAIGVHEKADLDQAIVAHGRILHDAIIISINLNSGTDLGSIDWVQSGASSLSEMVSDLVHTMDESVLDTQISTAFLTGIVSETDRFRNEHVSPHTMAVAGVLMSAGASTQLVSSKLEQEVEVPHELPEIDESADQSENDEVSNPDEQPAEPKVEKPSSDGVIEISHDEINIDESGKLVKVKEQMEAEAEALRKAEEEAAAAALAVPDVSDVPLPDVAALQPPSQAQAPSLVFQPPTFGGQLTANSEKVDENYVSAPDALSTYNSPSGSTLTHGQNIAPPTAPGPDQTLSELERSVNSPHVTSEVAPDQITPAGVPLPEPDYARDAVERAVQSSTDYKPEPIAALGAQPLGLSGLGGEADHQTPQIGPSVTHGPPPPPVPPPLT